jgi:hypothetical protein
MIQASKEVTEEHYNTFVNLLLVLSCSFYVCGVYGVMRAVASAACLNMAPD